VRSFKERKTIDDDEQRDEREMSEHLILIEMRSATASNDDEVTPSLQPPACSRFMRIEKNFMHI
jgi:hypothetical protein